jgi:hypothetical protein
MRLLIVLFLLFGVQAFAQSDRPRDRAHTFINDVSDLRSTYIHGTIDLIVATRGGFVLATDSRATSETGYSDDAQKAFAIGPSTAVVIAGLIGSEVSLAGFQLRDAMGTWLSHRSETANQRHESPSATDVAQTFRHGLYAVAGLLIPNPGGSRPSVVGAMSAVSVSPNGAAEWITMYVPLATAYDSSGIDYYTVGEPIPIYHSLALGLRFDVQALGFPTVVEKLMGANAPGDDEYSRSLILRKFYERKRAGTLDRFTIKEAVDLARTLVAATVALAPKEAGVGGPVDILTVTPQGISWVQRKTNAAAFPPPFKFRLFGGGINNGGQDLDGFECFRCTFMNAVLRYHGDGNLELVAPIIEGTCRLELSADARRKSPVVVERLLRVLSGKCEIAELR